LPENRKFCSINDYIEYKIAIVVPLMIIKNIDIKRRGISKVSLQEEVEERYAIVTKYLGLALSIAFVFFSIIGIYKVFINGNAYSFSEIADNLIVVNGILIYFLVRSGRAYPAKWLLLFITPIILFVLPILSGKANDNSLFWVPYGLIAMSILPLMICKWKEEAVLMISAVIYYLIMLLFIEKLLFVGYDADSLTVSLYEKQFFMLKAEQIALYLLLNGLVLYSRSLHSRLEKRLRLDNIHISEQKQELLTQNDDLVFIQSKLTELNQKILSDKDELKKQNKELLYYQSKAQLVNEELEMRVKRRTRDLEDRNARLKEYAFINAHLLRAPLCRIKGLTNLIGKNNEVYDSQIIEKLVISNNELEDIIKKITNILDDEKELNRELLYELYSRDEIKKSKKKSRG